MIDDETMKVIRARTKELAEAAPPFTTEQALLLRSVFSRYTSDDDAAGVAARGRSHSSSAVVW